jgi:ectoine hydroxylase-related dioxygenase (phytanoyl-CoA dioxygenase family)
MDELDTLSPPSAEQLDAYRRDGFVRVADALSETLLAEYREICTNLVRSLDGAARRQQFLRDYDERQREQITELLRPPGTTGSDASSETYARAFTQITNLWRHCAAMERLVRAPRLAQMAAALLGATGVRVYHDQALFKEAGGGHTPWHVDQFYWPLAGERTVTLWIPLQAVSADMGPLAFAPGSQRTARAGEAGRLAISDESEQRLTELLTDVPVLEDPFVSGEVSFHNGWTCHRAGANKTANTRAAFTVIYMASDVRMSEPEHRNHRLDAALWLPGVAPGDIAASDLNPLVYGT